MGSVTPKVVGKGVNKKRKRKHWARLSPRGTMLLKNLNLSFPAVLFFSLRRERTMIQCKNRSDFNSVASDPSSASPSLGLRWYSISDQAV
jgi:hypothetical protein